MPLPLAAGQMPAVAALGTAAIVGLLVMTLAARARIPAIVPLLLAGATLGVSGLGLVQTRALGAALPSLVELCVALIIFEGAMGLHPDQWRESRSTIRNLLTVGALITFLGATAAAYVVLGFPFSNAAIVGAILIVTGPTVVTPLLRHIRPRRRLADILRWEGIVVDPIGALVATTVLEAVLAQDEGASWGAFALGYARSAVVGSALGAALAGGLAALLRRDKLVDEELRGPLTLAVGVGTFALAEAAVAHSGLYAVTAGGLALAALAPPGLHDIERFLARLTSFFLALLFVLLAAVVDIASITRLGVAAPAFLVALSLVRAVSVGLSTAGSDLTLREKAFLAWLAPRGVVAAAVASFMSERLTTAGHEGGDLVRGAIFFVIVGTVVIQGATSRRVARALGVLALEPREVAIVGAERFGRDLAQELAAAGLPVTLIDKNEAKLGGLAAGVRTLAADAHDADETAPIDRSALAFVLAATPNDEANALVCAAFADEVGDERTFQLPGGKRALEKGGRHAAVRFPFAFGERLTGAAIAAAYYEGGRLATVPVEEGETGEALRKRLGRPLRPLVVLRADGIPTLVRDSATRFSKGARVVALEVPEPVVAAIEA